MVLQFREFRFDPERRKLMRGADEIHLPPRTFRLLEVLLESAPRAVAKEELIGRVWPDVVVEAGNLKTTISELREALGDGAKEARFVRTIHRFGYAFCSGVTRVETAHGGDVWQLVTDDGQRFVIREDEVVIGRDPACGVWIDSRDVSRRHARVWIADCQAMIEDLGSKNGTCVRGARIDGPVELHDGDALVLGTLPCVIRLHRAEDSTRSGDAAARR